ncbi:putative Ku family DNA helicase [Kalaharituber pfeilii]|nr:putative Ku family DNA helicase [Kalaharituber pfeilii]
MADKQASVYIVDVGRSMGQKRNGREESDLDFAMQWIWDKITSTVMTERKTDTIGVVGLRTDGTDNELFSEPSSASEPEDDAYKNITVLNPIQQFLMPQLRNLRENLKPSKTDSGDGISALVVAIQMIMRYCKKLKYIRNIYLVTNGTALFDSYGIDDIIKRIQEEGINLTILGVDFDDPDYGFKEKDKDKQKAANEAFLRNICEQCNGTFGTLAEAVEELGRPRLKKVRPVASYKGTLTLGDYLKDDTAMNIDIERYPRTMIAKPISASNYVAKVKPEDGEESETLQASSEADGRKMSAVRNERAYIVQDEEAPGGKKEVNREELEKGYLYGRAVVPISSTDESITVLETSPSYEILGFIPRQGYERYFSMSTTCVVVAQKTNVKAAIALSSLIHAVYELDNYILARLVTKKDKPPVLVAMAPLIEPDFEALIDVQLPFLEDVRHYRFPPLDIVKTVTGKVLDKHRNLPSDEVYHAMSNYVDKMDLSTFGRDDEGNPTDYVPPEDTYSPVLHRIDQVVRWRAIHPKEPLPPVYDILTKFSYPPKELLKLSQEPLDILIKASNVKKVPPKVRGKREREQAKPMSGLNVDELLRSEDRPTKRRKISSRNAIPEFKQNLFFHSDIEAIKDTCSQMAALIKETITNSFADILYDKAADMMRVMRNELIDLDEPEIYNDFIRDLKKAMLAGELGGNRVDMWKEVSKNNVGLVTNVESERSEVTEEAAKEFLLEN